MAATTRSHRQRRQQAARRIRPYTHVLSRGRTVLLPARRLAPAGGTHTFPATASPNLAAVREDLGVQCGRQQRVRRRRTVQCGSAGSDREYRTPGGVFACPSLPALTRTRRLRGCVCEKLDQVPFGAIVTPPAEGRAESSLMTRAGLPETTHSATTKRRRCRLYPPRMSKPSASRPRLNFSRCRVFR